MKIRSYFPLFKEEGEVIAAFGQAKLLKYLNGKYELRGGSKEEHIAAHEWISLFCHEVVVGDCITETCSRENPRARSPLI